MKRREKICLLIGSCALMTVFHLLFHPFFPNEHGALGHDYALFLPKLLDGYFWYHTNGLLAVPWFTPAFCGGIPLLPDPQSIYYSVPQFLSFVIDPLSAVYLTFLLFALLGLVGCYALLRYAFLLSPSASLLGACLFLFNGFYIHRMIIGHLTYHAFMLVPLIALMTLRRVSTWGRWQRTFDIVLAALLITYLFQAGMVNAILPAMGSVVVIGLVHGVLFRRAGDFALRLGFASLLACGLSLGKLVAAMSYLHQFGRDGYHLPGVQSLMEVARLVFHSLFIAPAHDQARTVLVNVQWLLERHEFEFGVSFVPVGIFLLAGGWVIAHRGIRTDWRQLDRWQWLQLGGIAALLCLPLLLNYYTPAWNAFLKQVPILKNSTSLVRWFCLYIPVVILFAALALHHTPLLHAYRRYIATGGILVILALNIITDRTYYQAQYYEPLTVTHAFHRVQTGGGVPTIEHIAVFTDAAGRLSMPPNRNNVLAQGKSQLLCYEPLFGYRLEYFPLETLRPGAVLAHQDGRLNVKNPACYVYPRANSCRPGEHFFMAQEEAAAAFVAYRPFRFQLPAWQQAANLINGLLLVGVTVYLLLYLPIGWWRNKGQTGCPRRLRVADDNVVEAEALQDMRTR